jgi:hypothetical protein
VQYADDIEAQQWVYRPEPPREGIPANRMERSLWLRRVACEAYQQGRLPACYLSAEEIRTLWPGGVRAPSNADELVRLADYPANGLFAHAFSPFAS